MGPRKDIKPKTFTCGGTCLSKQEHSAITFEIDNPNGNDDRLTWYMIEVEGGLCDECGENVIDNESEYYEKV